VFQKLAFSCLIFMGYSLILEITFVKLTKTYNPVL